MWKIKIIIKKSEIRKNSTISTEFFDILSFPSNPEDLFTLIEPIGLVQYIKLFIIVQINYMQLK